MHNTFNNDLERIRNYPKSPIEAFFGSGAHTNSQNLDTNIGPTPIKNAFKIGDNVHVDNSMQLQRTHFHHNQTTLSSANALLSNASSQAPAREHQLQSVNNPFLSNGYTIDGAPELTPTTGQQNINGLLIGYYWQPSYPVYSGYDYRNHINPTLRNEVVGSTTNHVAALPDILRHNPFANLRSQH